MIPPVRRQPSSVDGAPSPSPRGFLGKSHDVEGRLLAADPCNPLRPQSKPQGGLRGDWPGRRLDGMRAETATSKVVCLTPKLPSRLSTTCEPVVWPDSARLAQAATLVPGSIGEGVHTNYARALQRCFWLADRVTLKSSAKDAASKGSAPLIRTVLVLLSAKIGSIRTCQPARDSSISLSENRAAVELAQTKLHHAQKEIRPRRGARRRANPETLRAAAEVGDGSSGR
jgi:hypothetical protein